MRKRGSAEAHTVLHRLACDAIDPLLKKYIEQCLRLPARATAAVHQSPPWPLWSDASSTSWLKPAQLPTVQPPDPVMRINEVRRRRGEPELDAAEIEHVLGNLKRRELDEARYRNVCWVCHAVVDESTNPHCEACRWLVCWCGACREPEHPWPRPRGPVGPCRNEVYLFGEELSYPDRDYLGHPILTAVAPASDASEIRDLLARHGVGSVYHWSPGRSASSIIRNGILSRAQLHRRGIRDWVPHGYGSPEKERALSGHVGVAFRVKPLMMREWSSTPVVLELDPEILVLSTLRGAAALDRLFVREHVLADGQAEAWIKDRIPSAAIRLLHVATPDLAQRLEARLSQWVGETRTVPAVVVSTTMFA
jgi:hypothetical protein